MKKLIIAAVIILLASPSSVFSGLISPKNSRLGVAVSILPLKYFVQKIAVDKAAVYVMVPPGANPHSYEPKPKELRELSGSGLYVKVGTPIEFEVSWMGKLMSVNPKMAVCDSSKGIALINDYAEEETGEPKKGHDQYGTDPHIWTSLRNGVIMAENVKNALSAVDPANQAFYEANCGELKKELNKLDNHVGEMLKSHAGASFIVFHSGWGYYARDYSLNEISIEVGGKEPSARDMAGIIKKAKQEKIKAVFVSPEFSLKSSRAVASEIGGKVISVDHLSENIPREIQKMTEAITQSYGK